jgi:probable rRNA maturation factor
MKKDKKIKLISSVVLSTKKFNKIKKSKNSSFEITSEKIIITAKIAELKKRIQFILSLMCDFSTEIGIRICDENEMLSSNTYYRGKNYPTDVLSFPYSDDLPNESEYSYLGDILICLPVCYNQAKKARVTISQELEKMIIHGIVHLKGFDHERNKSAWKVMTLLEQSLQNELQKEMGKANWCKAILSSK